MDGQWKFLAYDKKHDQEGGFGYWIENFEGDYTFIEYEKEKVNDPELGEGYWVTHLDGTRNFFKNPEVVIESNDETFDPEAAN